MTNLVEELLQKKSQAPRYLMRFGEALNQGFKFFICIEGDDEPYYSNIIRNQLHYHDIAFIRCDGRENVIDLIEVLQNHTDEKYRNAITFGFVDKDYHLNYINPFPEKIYITSTYSFENYYTTNETFKRILSAIFHTKIFGNFSGDYDRCITNFIKVKNEFLESIFKIDCILRAASYDLTHKITTNKKTYTDKVKLSNAVIKIDKFTEGWSETVNKWLEFTSEYVTNDNYLLACGIFMPFDPDQFSLELRGKYIFDFFIRYLKLLLIDATIEENPKCFIERKKIEIEHKRKCKNKHGGHSSDFYGINLKEESFNDAISLLATYADIPKCLTEFIDNKMKPKIQLSLAS